MDLINASSSRGAASALEQLQGSLSRRIEKVEEEILDLLSGIDAAIDYPDELEEDVFSSLPEGIRAARAEIDSLISGGMASRMGREGARIAILGRPNAGKSSLVNKLLNEERSIVSDIPGTTRDALDTKFIFDSQPMTIIDTAGIRRKRSIEDRSIERYSVMRSLGAIRRCNVAVSYTHLTLPTILRV